MQQVLRRVNLPNQKRPKFAESLRFPDSVSALEAENITDLMGKYTKLLAYVKGCWSSLKRDELSIERQINEVKRDLYVKNPSNFSTRGNGQYAIQFNPKVFELNGNLNLARQEIVITESHIDVYEKFINTLSRELSRRYSN